MQRCIGITSNKKRCRRKIFEPNKFFCCESHKPKNDILNEVCFLCSEKINMKEIKILKCNHAFHRPCLMDWYNKCLEENQEYEMECLICRTEVIKNNYKNKINKLNMDKNYYNSNILKIIDEINI